MTTLDVTSGAEGLQIRLIGVGEDKAALLEGFNSCASGNCACSTDEYAKVASMNVQSEGDAITIDVRTKPGETIDPSCINDCLPPLVD